MFHWLSKQLESTIFTVLGYPDETLSLVFDILLQKAQNIDDHLPELIKIKLKITFPGKDMKNHNLSTAGLRLSKAMFF